MHSIRYCREILEQGGKKYSESEVKMLRDVLYILAEIEYKNKEEFLRDGKKSNNLYTCLN